MLIPSHLHRPRLQKIAARVSLVFLVSFFWCTAPWAQATAQITGTVKDQSGAVLPGAEVTVTQTDTGVARTAVSNEAGVCILPNFGRRAISNRINFGPPNVTLNRGDFGTITSASDPRIIQLALKYRF